MSTVAILVSMVAIENYSIDLVAKAALSDTKPVHL